MDRRGHGLEELAMQSLGAIDHPAGPGPHDSSWIDCAHETCPRADAKTHGDLFDARLTSQIRLFEPTYAAAWRDLDDRQSSLGR
jgi:hypothetical protein